RVIRMSLNREDGDVSFVRAIGPEHSSSRRCSVFEIRLENSEPTLPAQGINFMRSQAVVPRILSQVAERLYDLAIELLLRLIQLVPAGAIDEIIPFSLHPRYSHPD